MINENFDEDFDEDLYADDWDNDREYMGFANPGGNSSLRAETEDNPRDCPCPTCGANDVLTRLDKRLGYQCDRCADNAERGGY